MAEHLDGRDELVEVDVQDPARHEFNDVRASGYGPSLEMRIGERYTSAMPKAPQGSRDIGVRELRDHLSRYLAQVADGQEITVTDRGKAIARVVPVDRLSKMDQLIAEGVITPPSRPRTPASELPRIEVEGDLMEFIRWAQSKV